MKGLEDFVATARGLAQLLGHKSADLAKIEASIYYLKAVQTARFVVLGIVALAALLMLMSTALIALHLFVFFLLPVSAAAKFWIAAGLTLFDFALVGTALYFIASEKMWMKLTKSNEVTEHTIEETAPEIAHEPPRDIDDLKKAS